MNLLLAAALVIIAAVVLPDGFLFGEGVKARIKELLDADLERTRLTLGAGEELDMEKIVELEPEVSVRRAHMLTGSLSETAVLAAHGGDEALRGVRLLRAGLPVA